MLTKEQIQHLYNFCEKKSVRYYDLQVELVDHLAEAIEECMNQQPHIDFETALAQVYKGFGIFGFAHVVQEKTIAIAKKKSKRRWEYFKTYISYPKIVFTIALSLLLCSPFYIFDRVNLNIYYVTLFILTALLGVVLWIIQRIKCKHPTLKLLALNYVPAWGVFGILLQFPSFYFNYFKWQGTEPQGNLWLNIFLIVGCIFLILFALAAFHTNKKIYEEVRNQYPLAFE